MRTVCTFSYLSYEEGLRQRKRLVAIIELNKGFNMRWLTLKADAFEKSPVYLTVTERAFLVCTSLYFTYKENRNSKNYLKKVAEHELSFNLICLNLKTDENCPIAHVITLREEQCEQYQCFHAVQQLALPLPCVHAINFLPVFQYASSSSRYIWINWDRHLMGTTWIKRVESASGNLALGSPFPSLTPLTASSISPIPS